LSAERQTQNPHRSAPYKEIHQMDLGDVPADLLDLAWDAWARQSPDDELGAIRAALAAVLPAHKRQVSAQTLRDLDAGDIRPEELAAAGLDTDHIVDLRADGWTIQHPLTCGTDLFACPVNRAAERDLTGPPREPGRFECGVEDGEFWIGEGR
jgi:hypothetical protein